MNQNTEEFSPEEVLKNEIELMKLKLEVEHGAIIGSETNTIPPEIELEWYKHIMHYEKMCKEHGFSTVYEMIGSPSYRHHAELSTEETSKALVQLMELMHEKGVLLSFLVEGYAPEVIYQFITEELFQKEVCRYRGPSANGHVVFCYEDFHPNHTYDLEEATRNLWNDVFDEELWQLEFLKYTYEKTMVLNHKEMTLEEYYKKILAFKSQYPHFLFSGEKKIDMIHFNLNTKKASVKGSLEMNAVKIPFTVFFEYNFIWTIAGLEMDLID